MSAMPAWSGDGAALRSLSPDAVRWLWRMGRALQAELAWPAPLYTVLFILSQIALLLALLLPWNILATLSLGHSSVRLQMIFGELGSGTVVTILMTLVLVCFVLHLAAEAGAARLGRYAAAIIVERHDKLGFSNSLREQASTYYRRFLRFFAMLAYCLIAAVLIGLSYPALLVILIAYVVAGTLLVSFLPLAAEQGVGAELRGKGWWGLGFLLLVGWVIHDAWRGAMPQFWAVFMALLLSRQILIFLMLSATILAGLLRRKERIERCSWPMHRCGPPHGWRGDCPRCSPRRCATTGSGRCWRIWEPGASYSTRRRRNGPNGAKYCTWWHGRMIQATVGPVAQAVLPVARRDGAARARFAASGWDGLAGPGTAECA